MAAAAAAAVAPRSTAQMELEIIRKIVSNVHPFTFEDFKTVANITIDRITPREENLLVYIRRFYVVAAKTALDCVKRIILATPRDSLVIKESVLRLLIMFAFRNEIINRLDSYSLISIAMITDVVVKWCGNVLEVFQHIFLHRQELVRIVMDSEIESHFVNSTNNTVRLLSQNYLIDQLSA